MRAREQETRAIHICIVTTAHPTDDVRVYEKFARAFRIGGFAVTWVGPAQAFFDVDESLSYGIDFVLGPPNRGRIDRVLAAVRIYQRAARVADVDVYYSPDPDAAQAALLLAAGNGAKVIFDIHEVYHGALLDRWLMGLRLSPVRELLRRRISHTASKCDLVLGVSEQVLAPYLVPATKYRVVRSCAPGWFADDAPADVCGAGRSEFRIMHGKCDAQRGALRVLGAMAIAAPQVPDLRIVMFANGSPENDPHAQAALTLAATTGCENALDLRKSIPMQQMPHVLRSCDAGFIAYGRELGVDSLPNRLFEYMAAGLPIVAPSYATEIARIIRAERCGLLVDFEDSASIAQAIVQLRRDPALCRDMGRRARLAFIARHNWEAESRPVIEVIRSWFPSRNCR